MGLVYCLTGAGVGLIVADRCRVPPILDQPVCKRWTARTKIEKTDLIRGSPFPYSVPTQLLSLLDLRLQISEPANQCFAEAALSKSAQSSIPRGF
jgi:hypothetical protein